MSVSPSQLERAKLAMLILSFIRSVVIALVRLIILFDENLDDVTCKPQSFHLLNALLTTTANADKTSKCSWTIVEPALEVLSGCLPTMAPLLHMRTHLQNFSSMLRSSFNSRSITSGLDDTKTSRREYRHELNETKLRLGGEPAVISGASAKRFESADVEDDLVPLHSIKVRNDVEWKEIRNDQL